MAICSSDDRNNAASAPLGTDREQYTHALEQLIDVVQQLSLAQNIQEIVDITSQAARMLTDASGATLVLRDGEMGYYGKEDAISPRWKEKLLPIGHCIERWCMKHHQTIAISDTIADERIPPDVCESNIVKSLVMVPIRQFKPIGTIGNYWETTHMATAEEIKLLQLLADSTSIAIDKVQIRAAPCRSASPRPPSCRRKPSTTSRVSSFDDGNGPTNLPPAQFNGRFANNCQ